VNHLKILIRTGTIGLFVLVIGISCHNISSSQENPQPDILSYEVAPEAIQFYYKNEKGALYRNYKRLKIALSNKGQELQFAMNGGMYKKRSIPKGLYIEKGKMITSIDRIEEGYGNFYLQPNGIFYVDNKQKGCISTTTDFKENSNILYATQSGPMLVIDGAIHPEFDAISNNLNIRNGVGILPNGNLLFAMSTKELNFYTFATFFRERGCKDALYLDGFVSRMYLPSQNWIQEDGNFGVIIGQAK